MEQAAINFATFDPVI